MTTNIPSAARGFLDFVNASPTPFHVVAEACKKLDTLGFMNIKERESWDDKLIPGGKYYFTRNASSIIAFIIGGKYQPGNGYAIVAAHTDSPCLKIKPISNKTKGGYLMVGVQTYGGGLWHTWFDRDLSIAGRVVSNNTHHHLVKLCDPILRIPTLAIHLDRSVNNGFTFNYENQLVPILCSSVSAQLNTKDNNNPDTTNTEANSYSNTNKHHSIMLSALANQLHINSNDITDVELCLFDTQPATIGGGLSEYIFSPRCDNLIMSYTSLMALLNHAQDTNTINNNDTISMVSLFDNEEVGSLSAYGADSHLLESTLRRISNSISMKSTLHSHSYSHFEEAMQKSFLISADMAHALHPNYIDKHEDLHQPRMNQGVVIKHNANQKYATTALTSALLRSVANKVNVPLQEFVVRNDSPCGSTIGPILSGKLGIRTIDVGNPQLSMHSIREQAGVHDVTSAINLFTSFFAHYSELDRNLLVD